MSCRGAAGRDACFEAQIAQAIEDLRARIYALAEAGKPLTSQDVHEMSRRVDLIVNQYREIVKRNGVGFAREERRRR